jgi:hypothetical protein
MTDWMLSPDVVDVAEAEYRRLLGYPLDAQLSERACELAARTREWYARHGRPWIYAREAATLDLASGAVEIEGVLFHSSRLRTALQQAEAHSVVLTAVSAGLEAEEEARRRWLDAKPDEYFFLEVYASSVVEHLIAVAGAHLCEWADGKGLAVLPHASPGYSQWNVAEQPALLRLFRRSGAVAFPGPLEALDSGALVPKKSQLAVFGITRAVDRTARLTDLIPCRQCALPNCQYRRTPYARIRPAERPRYSIPEKALRRWAAERLLLENRADGTIHARFRYDGVTCTNLGTPLAFDYEVTLGPDRHGFPIIQQQCMPAPGDSGYLSMCQYLADGAALMAAIEHEKPLAGRPLTEVLSWQRAGLGAGCYCEPASREHKWGLVLETIHYALVGQTSRSAAGLQAGPGEPENNEYDS